LPQIASIVLANGESTPVNHTFAPLGQNPKTGFWVFEDQSPRVSSSTPMGWPRLAIRARRASEGGPGENAQTRINRVEFVFSMPALETVGTSDSGLTPPATVAYVDRIKGEYLLPARNVLADRKDDLAFSKALMSNSIFVDLVHNLSQIYG